MQKDGDVAEKLDEIVIHERANEVRLGLELTLGRRVEVLQRFHLVENLVRSVDVVVRLGPDVQDRGVERRDLIVIDLAVRRRGAAEFGVVGAQVSNLGDIGAVGPQTLQAVIHPGDRRARGRRVGDRALRWYGVLRFDVERSVAACGNGDQQCRHQKTVSHC